MAVPGNHYSSFIDKYFDIASWMRNALIGCSKLLCGIFGIQTFRFDEYVLRIINGPGIRLVYSCLGFGVLSFWAAYSIASAKTFKGALTWLIPGLLMIFFINVVRITLVLASALKGWSFPFGWDHHTWFNIVSYLFIFAMIFLHTKMQDRKQRMITRQKDKATSLK